MSHDVEDRLRAALAARADQVTAESLGPQRPVEARVVRLRPRRFRRAAAVLAAAASVAVAVGLGVAVRGLPERPAPDGSRPAAAPTAPTASPRVPTASPPVSFEGVSFRVPDGWVYRLVAEGTACVQPIGSPRPDGECTPYGIEIVAGGSGRWPRDVIDRDDGWIDNAEECRGVAHPDENYSQVTGNRITKRERRRVADRDATYREWQVTCDDMDFVVRLWWQPDIPLVVVTRALDRRYDATVDSFLASVRVAGS